MISQSLMTSTITKLSNLLARHPYETITSIDLTRAGYQPFGERASFGTWEKWAEAKGLKVCRKFRCGAGFAIVVNTRDLAALIGVEWPQPITAIPCEQAKTDISQVKLTDKALSKLSNWLADYQGDFITTSYLSKCGYNPFRHAGGPKNWGEWALSMGLKVYARHPGGSSHTLTFSTKELAERIGIKKEFPAPSAPAAESRHSLDQVLRDFNATTETLHQDVADRLQEIALHLTKQDRDQIEVREEFNERFDQILKALQHFFKRLEGVQKQQEVLMRELGVAPPVIGH